MDAKGRGKREFLHACADSNSSNGEGRFFLKEGKEDKKTIGFAF